MEAIGSQMTWSSRGGAVEAACGQRPEVRRPVRAPTLIQAGGGAGGAQRTVLKLHTSSLLCLGVFRTSVQGA